MNRRFSIKYMIVSIGIIIISSCLVSILAGVMMIVANPILTFFDIKNITYPMSLLIVLIIIIIRKIF